MRFFFSLIFLIFPLTFCNGQTKLKGVQLLKVSSLGRTARLGSLYNARTEAFSSTSIFRENLPASLIHRTGSPSTNTKFGVSRSISERSQLLDISSTLTLSALWGRVKCSGTARFIQEETTKTNSVVGSLVYQTRTVDEMLEIFFDDMKNQISHSTLNNALETHVVVGIGWGSNVVVKFEDLNLENRNVMTVRLEMDKILKSIIGGILDHLQHEQIEKLHTFSLKVFGDLSLEEKDFPTNVTQVFEFIQSIPRLLQATNGGKGKEMHFYLMPIERVRNYLNFNSTTWKTDLNLHNDLSSSSSFDLPVDEAASQIEVLEQQAIVQLKLNELATSIRNHRNHINNTALHRLTALENSFKNLTTSYKNQMIVNLVAVRSDIESGKLEPNSNDHINFFQGYREDASSSLESIENSIDEEFRPLRLKLDLVSFILSQGAFWLGRENFLDTTIIKIFKTVGMKMPICAIHFYEEFLHKNEALDFISAIFEDGLNKHAIPIVIDCDSQFSHEACQALNSREKRCTLLFHGIQEEEQEQADEQYYVDTAKQALDDWRSKIVANAQNSIKNNDDVTAEIPNRLLGTEFSDSGF